jgi:hypothetical protein
MSGAPTSLPHVLSRSCRHCTAGYAIARPVLLRIPQLAGPLGSSHTALVLTTKLIDPLDKRHRRTTQSQVATDIPGNTHKYP